MSNPSSPTNGTPLPCTISGCCEDEKLFDCLDHTSRLSVLSLNQCTVLADLPVTIVHIQQTSPRDLTICAQSAIKLSILYDFATFLVTFSINFLNSRWGCSNSRTSNDFAIDIKQNKRSESCCLLERTPAHTYLRSTTAFGAAWCWIAWAIARQALGSFSRTNET